jgi:hypothetical protein
MSAATRKPKKPAKKTKGHYWVGKVEQGVACPTELTFSRHLWLGEVMSVAQQIHAFVVEINLYTFRKLDCYSRPPELQLAPDPCVDTPNPRVVLVIKATLVCSSVKAANLLAAKVLKDNWQFVRQPKERKGK